MNQVANTISLLIILNQTKLGSFADSPNAGDAESNAGEIERIW